MADDERLAILEAVSRGELRADEAAERLRATRTTTEPTGASTGAYTDGPAADEPAAEHTGEPTRRLPPPDRAHRLRVEASAGAVRVVGDDTVSTVHVDGDHDLVEEGDALVVRCSPLRTVHDLGVDLEWGFSRRHTGRPYAIRHGGPRFRGFDDLRRRVQVTVRVNPDLPLEVRVSAGALSVRGVRAPITCDVDAGAARLHDVRAPLRANVNAGSLSVDGCLQDGQSVVTCDMGAATIRLDPASDVRIQAGVNLGRCEVRVPGDDRIGTGRGLLVVDGSMSSVTVSVADDVTV
jgi:hypothetical protein